MVSGSGEVVCMLWHCTIFCQASFSTSRFPWCQKRTLLGALLRLPVGLNRIWVVRIRRPCIFGFRPNLLACLAPHQSRAESRRGSTSLLADIAVCSVHHLLG